MGGHFDIDNLKNQIQVLESKINDENIWSDKDRYNEIITELSSWKKHYKWFRTNWITWKRR